MTSVATTGAGPQRVSVRFLLAHPAHAIALGFGSGLAPKAPGTVGTLWAWVAFIVLDHWLDARGFAVLIAAAALLGWWACTRAAQHLGAADPGAIVWDEVVAFWIVLWVVTPASWPMQFAAFALFRFFDAVKPGPVAWADALYPLHAGQAIGWRQGFVILFDDLVAALCTLVVLAIWQTLRAW